MKVSFEMLAERIQVIWNSTMTKPATLSEIPEKGDSC